MASHVVLADTPLPPSPVSLTFKHGAQGSVTAQEFDEPIKGVLESNPAPIPCTFIFPNRRRRPSRAGRTERSLSGTLSSLHRSSIADHNAHTPRPPSPPLTMHSPLRSSSNVATLLAACDRVNLMPSNTSRPKGLESPVGDGQGEMKPMQLRQNSFLDQRVVSTEFLGCYSIPTQSVPDISPAAITFPPSFQPSESPLLVPSTLHNAFSSHRASNFSVSAHGNMQHTERPVECASTCSQRANVEQESCGPAGPISPSTSFSPGLQRSHKPTPLILVPHPVHTGSTVESVEEQSTILTPGLDFSASLLSPYSVSPYRGGTSTIPAVDCAKGLRVELWIDQEDHRMIRAAFTFKRHIPQHPSIPAIQRPLTAHTIASKSSKDKDRFWDSVTPAGLVDFRPSGKQIGTFNCGKTSRDATIKRLIVDGKDDKDYLSHNIILPLKENGVYVVYGFEYERKRKGSSRVFVWKFEYTVEDKTSPHASFQGIPGEKLVRPVSFICSPEMLASSQKMTVSVMHLLGKKFTSALKAQKIQPPAIPSSLPFIATGTEFGASSRSSSRRRSRISNAVQSLSRPTTPASDKRLKMDPRTRRGSDAGYIRPIIPGTMNEPAHRNASDTGDLPSMEPAHGPSPIQPMGPFNLIEGYMPPTPSLSLKGLMIGARTSSETLSHTINRRRRASEASSRPLRASISALGIRQTLFGRPRSNSRPATASARLTQLGGNNEQIQDALINGKASTFKSRAPLWSIPVNEDLVAALHGMSHFVNAEQCRLEALSRSHWAEETTIERLDSTGDLRSDMEDFGSAIELPGYTTMPKSIGPPQLIKEWIPLSPSISPWKCPTTAPCTTIGSPIGSTSHLSLQRSNFNHGSAKAFPSIEIQSSVSYNASTTSLILPVPPRKLRHVPSS
ncbi:hypothetical protein FRC18_009392 [Serendipita sp. 400]|nr:hypothetical protein FRC18_009392 [Serendipita sp. 400]